MGMINVWPLLLFCLCRVSAVSDDVDIVHMMLYETNSLNDRADIVFLLDRSGSVGRANFEIEKGFVESLLMHVAVEANASRVAVLSYSTTVKTHVNYIKNPRTKCFLALEIENVVYEDSGATDIAAALEGARVILAEGRPNVNKVIILIGDGIATHGVDPVPVANRLKKETNTEIFVFGIGIFLHNQLRAMASSSDHFFECLGFSEFDRLARRIRGDPHAVAWSVQSSDNSNCDHLCESSYKGQPDDPGCCDHHARCSCGLLAGTHTCVCGPGYFGLKGTLGQCRACPVGMYKSKLELISSCTQCPLYSTTNSTASKSVKDCHCRDGYSGNPSNGIPCSATKCPTLQDPTNGFLFGKCTNEYSSTCHFMCKEGFELVPSEGGVLTCGSDGQWSHEVPFCRRLLCTRPPRLLHGKFNCSQEELTVGSRCDFICSEGFNLQGSDVMECMPGGQWSDVQPTCSEVECPIPTALKHGTIINCDSSKRPKYSDTCVFRCNSGYELEGPDMVHCEANGVLTDVKSLRNYLSYMPICRDVEKPEISCPASRKVPQSLRMSSAQVSWPNPEASDNSGVFPKIVSHPPFIQNNGTFPIGETIITYEAIDSSGLKNSCNFSILVIDTEKPHVMSCPQEIRLNTSNTQVAAFWEEPTFKDNSFQQLTIYQSHKPGDVFSIGRNTVFYSARDRSGNEALCDFNVIVTQNSCHYYPPPTNGALVCDDWMYGQFCQTHCENGFDFVDKPAEWYECTEEATWQTIPPNYPLPWPHCLRKSNPNGLRQMIHGYYYYSGDCADPRVQSNIKKAFLHFFFTKFDVQKFCTKTANACTQETIKVTCGPTWRDNMHTRRKRDIKEHDYKQELNIQLDVFLDHAEMKDLSEEELEELLVIFKDIDWDFAWQLENEFSGNFTAMNDETLEVERGNISVVATQTQVLCSSGSLMKDDRCMLCPAGSHHHKESDECIPCSKGFFQEQEGQEQCVSCPENTTTLDVSAKNHTECRGICPAGTYSLTGIETCLACPQGSYQEETEQTSCVPCPLETTTATEASTLYTDCKRICNPGTFSQNGLEPCDACEIGKYQTETGKTMCDECPSNFTTTFTGTRLLSDCLKQSTEFVNLEINAQNSSFHEMNRNKSALEM